MWRLIDLICDFFVAASREMTGRRVAFFMFVMYLGYLSVELKYGRKWITEAVFQYQSQVSQHERLERFRQSRY